MKSDFVGSWTGVDSRFEQAVPVNTDAEREEAHVKIRAAAFRTGALASEYDDVLASMGLR